MTEPDSGGQGQWYYLVANEQRGPITREVLVAEIRSGRLGAAVPVRREDSDDWRPADAVAELREAGSPAVPPPVPPAPGVLPQAPVTQSDGIAGLVPYRNGPALIGYYLGVFSLIPCIGPLLGIAAIVLGIVGLTRAARAPQIKGKAHAWVAISLGVVSIAYHVILAPLIFSG